MQTEVPSTSRECRLGRLITAIVLLVLGIPLAAGGVRPLGTRTKDAVIAYSLP